jgi:crotonobetainyl-CoA:carnitine CoA-transferase CaiB-like acyl-CoA transferase
MNQTTLVEMAGEKAAMRDGGETSAGPLTGMTVIETASYLTGPMTGMMLADLGATVIKVEPPGGDPFRKFGHKRNGVSALWVNANHGKASIELDLKTPQGARRLKALLSSADVLVENWRPGVADALGVGHEAISLLNPRLVRVAITGYGATGPLAGTPVFDAMIQARTGIVDAEAAAGAAHLTPYSVVDKVTASFAAQTVLAALLDRVRTGRGTYLSVPMLDIMAYFNFPDMLQHRTFADDVGEAIRSASQTLPASDGAIVISPLTGTQMANTLRAVGREEWKAELRQIADPVVMAAEFFRRVGTAVSDNTRAHWLQRFEEFDVPAAPVMTLDEHLADPQVAHNDIYRTVESPAGPVRRARYPIRFDGRTLAPTQGPPALGAHQSLHGAVT